MTERFLRFRDRRNAGKELAQELHAYARRKDVIVLGLPRGGVEVAYEVARTLELPLDVFVVRKLGTPGHEELAMGAIAAGGIRVRNEDVIAMVGVSERQFEQTARKETEEVERRAKAFRGDRPALEFNDKVVILVDDGLATGATMKAAVAAVRSCNPAAIVVAVPVGARETCAEISSTVEELVCLVVPARFFAVGEWYWEFDQTTDEQVRELLRASADPPEVKAVR